MNGKFATRSCLELVRTATCILSGASGPVNCHSHSNLFLLAGVACALMTISTTLFLVCVLFCACLAARDKGVRTGRTERFSGHITHGAHLIPLHYDATAHDGLLILDENDEVSSLLCDDQGVQVVFSKSQDRSAWKYTVLSGGDRWGCGKLLRK
jgi:hypothetical protein